MTKTNNDNNDKDHGKNGERQEKKVTLSNGDPYVTVLSPAVEVVANYLLGDVVGLFASSKGYTKDRNLIS